MPYHERDIIVGGGDQGHILACKAARDFTVGNKVLTIAVNAGGTGYTVGDTLTISGGTTMNSDAAWAAQIEVLTLGGGGAVATARIKNSGAYSANPGGTGAATTGGTGTGATFNLTFQNGWTSDMNTYVDSSTEFEWIAHGVNGSGSHPYVGMQTFTSGGNTQIQVAVMTNYSGAFSWHQQPGISRVRQINTDSPRVPVPDASIRVFFYVNPRRGVYIFRNAPSYEMAYLGLFNPYVLDPANDYPLPLICAGTTSSDSFNSASAFSTTSHSALTQGASNAGNMRHTFRRTDGVYATMYDPSSGGASSECRIWPYMQRLENAEAEAFDFSDNIGVVTPAINQSGVGDTIFNTAASASQHIAPAPYGASGRVFMLLPMIMVADMPGSSSVLGELDGVLAIISRGNASEDRVEAGGVRYCIFPNCNASGDQFVYAMAEV